MIAWARFPWAGGPAGVRDGPDTHPDADAPTLATTRERPYARELLAAPASAGGSNTAHDGRHGSRAGRAGRPSHLVEQREGRGWDVPFLEPRLVHDLSLIHISEPTRLG